MKIPLLSTLAGLAIGFAVPALAQEQNNEVCAIAEYSVMTHKGYVVTIYVREADEWKIRMAYVN